MNSETGPGSSSMSTAVQMMVGQMKAERRSFWGILVVFFLLLAGIGGMIVWNMMKLNAVAEDTRAEHFRSVGESSSALADLRSAQSSAAYAQHTADDLSLQGQKRLKSFLAAARTGASDATTAEAIAAAKDHLLGRPLNFSTAAVVAAASDAKALTPSQKALLDTAMYDWTANTGRMSPAERAAEKQQLNAMVAALEADPQLAYYGHAAMAAFYYRDANSDAVYMVWDRKVGEATEGVCSELVKEVDAAMQTPANPPTKDPEAQGLKLSYWHGQCLRRHGEADKARADFEAMMGKVGGDDFPASDPLKFQAFHGAAMTSPAVLGEAGGDADVEKAIMQLKLAGDYRMLAGMTEAGKTSSTANVGLLMLRLSSPDRYVQALEYTEAIDAELATTWNLVARLVAAKSLKQGGLPAAFTDATLKQNDAALRAKYTAKEIDEIIFHTLAEIAYQKRTSLPKRELSKLLTADYQPILEQVDACIGKQMKCYEAEYGKK